MAKMKLVETPTQTDLLDNLIEINNQISDRFQDITNVISIERSISPEEGCLQRVKTAMNAILDIKIQKKRKSRSLLRTWQEIFLVLEKEEDAIRIALLDSYIRPGGFYGVPDKHLFDKLCCDSSAFQLCEFAGVEPESVTGMNSINKFVTYGGLAPPNKGIRHKLIYDPNDRNLGYRQLPLGDYKTLVRQIFDWNFNWCEEKNCVTCDDEVVSYKKVAETIQRSLYDLNKINERLDVYIQQLSISAPEFFSLLPDEVNTLLDKLVEEEKAKQLRASRVIRKTANVSLTFDLAVELDTLGDIEDIKEVISKKVREELGSKVKIGIGSRSFGGDYLDVKDTKFSGVEVVL